METKMAKLTPYMNIGPGEFIKEEIEIRNWTNEDLAQVLNLTAKTISELLNNKQRITIDTANLLSKAFGQTPQYWLNLDNNYRLRIKENNPNVVIHSRAVEIKSKIYERMPINDMIKKGWIKKYKDADELKNIFLHFWNLNELNYNWFDTLSVPNTRKSDAYSNFNSFYLLTWAQMAKRSSEKFSVSDFNKKQLIKLAEQISDYSVMSNGVSKFIRDLYDTGVIFFCLSHLPKTYLDGASFLHNDKPIIVYTKRYDRLDNFWFTIAHEIGHVIKHIKTEKDVFIDDLKVEDNSKVENEANEYASKILKTTEILEYFDEYKRYTSEYRVMEAAEELNIHSAIITGILKHYKILMYNRLNHLNEPVSDKIPKKYFIENL